MNLMRKLARRASMLAGGTGRLDGSIAALDAIVDRLRQYESTVLHPKPDASEAESQKFQSRIASPFVHYHSVFDAEETMKRHHVADLRPRHGHLTNFLGVAIDTKFFPQLLADRGGEVEGIPIPGNWHADMAEFAAVLRAVDLASERFTIIELGCGWGCWMNNAGVAARRRGLDVHVIGVEGDEGHVRFANEACETNGFSESQVTLYRGIAAANAGFALFPRQGEAGVAWGLQPIFGATEDQRQQAGQFGSHDELPMIPLADISAAHRRVDLLHIDIQGGEADLIENCLPVLQSKVAYMVVGTHSRQIEGRLFEVLLDAGWRLEIERPGLLKLDGDTPYMWVDGIQGWRNPVLLAPNRVSRVPPVRPNSA